MYFLHYPQCFLYAYVFHRLDPSHIYNTTHSVDMGQIYNSLY